MWVHRLSDIDLTNKRANCSNCGPVDIKVTKSHSPTCRNKIRAYNNSTRYKGMKKEETCVVCGSDKRICYDHSHKSGEFRGWLCNACNVALGLVKDNPDILRKLADYLEK